MYVRRAVKHLADLAGVQLTAQHDKLIDDAILGGISMAEKKAHAYADGLALDGPKSSAEKLDVAARTARSIAPEALADVPPEVVEARIEAKLVEVRASLRPPMLLMSSPRDLIADEPTHPETPKAKR